MPTTARSPWRKDEIELIVSDYLEMLQIELAGGAVVKAERNRALRKLIRRSRPSIEFKHRNISAVLEAFGLPFIQGYKPARHYQSGLFEVVGNHLDDTGLNSRLALARPPGGAAPASLVYEHAPSMPPQPNPAGSEIRRIIGRFDPAARDARARALGKAGEEFLLHAERVRLSAHGRDDLARRVRWVAEEDGDGAGYDILSFSNQGKERLLEVKTTNGPATTPFWISENERRVSEDRRDAFRLTRLYNFSREPAAYRLKPPLTDHVRLVATQYRASFS